MEVTRVPQTSGPTKRSNGGTRKPGGRPAPRKPKARRPAAKTSNLPSAKSGTSAKSKNSSLSKLLSPENIQETIKSVGNLRTQVKKWMVYLQQADQVLDTIFVTSNSLRETGVLDKIVKQRGKNLSTEDFTNILVALMNSPAGSQLLKSMGGGSSESESESEPQESVPSPAGQGVINGQTATARRPAANGRKRAHG
ncbi:hypothetical protein [Alicyclobacillus mengziensis]|uniref:Uncharacterized protein n=1 Tax=Alicyclobacillus mengziensis TaxID=2931921 RepID=A0A9X7VZ15_9BACL|nr:hypothetical protein [Alicyclobacillus mengziensis]QSO47649.1 hypothetical protein JZ786_00885 [Alicyclobacillus mengziensis]